MKTQNALADGFHMPRQSINSAAAALAKQGYVALEQLPGARSGKALRLTVTGKAFCDRVIYPFFGKYFAMFISAGTIVVIRILASRFRWNIPRAEQLQRMHRTSGKNT